MSIEEVCYKVIIVLIFLGIGIFVIGPLFAASISNTSQYLENTGKILCNEEGLEYQGYEIVDDHYKFICENTTLTHIKDNVIVIGEMT